MYKLLTAMLALLLTTAAARAATGADHVKIDLLADTTAVKPGQPFTVGVRFTIDPGWHIYWTNPGDSGLATKATVTAPAGFTVGPTQFPAPAVLPQAGGNVNYGYEGEVLMLVPITPPNDLAAGKQITFKADALYLVCQETCLPGKGSTTLDVPVSADAAAANADAFDAWKARVPVAADPEHVASVTGTVDSTITPDGNAATVAVVWKGPVPADVQWVPDAGHGFDVTPPKMSTADGVTRATFHVKLYETKGTRDTHLKGVLIYSPAAGPRRAVTTTTPIPIDGPSTDKK